jgi:hypothetical protein
MPLQTIPNDVHVEGRLTAAQMSVPANAIVDASVASDAKIAAAKVCHRIAARRAQVGTAATETVGLHIATAAGTVHAVRVAVIGAAIGAATVTVDIKKNGTTILTSVVTVNSGTAARTAVTGLLSVTAFAAGDVFEAVIVATAGGGTLPTGLLAELTVSEDPS